MRDAATSRLASVADALFRFAGLHVASGQVLTRLRDYDPRNGRWLTRDLLGEISDPAANLYRYVWGDPTSLVDPSGLLCFPSFFGLLSFLGSHPGFSC